jgi:hypothetical protein
VTFNNLKRGLVRLWIVIGCAVDLYLGLLLGISIHDGTPLGTSWSVLFLVVIVAHALWVSILGAVLWVLNGFFLKTDG